MLQGDSFTALNDPDEEKIRARIGVYYNYFTKPSKDENVVFSVPYNDISEDDAAGLGIRILKISLLIENVQKSFLLICRYPDYGYSAKEPLRTNLIP